MSAMESSPSLPPEKPLTSASPESKNTPNPDDSGLIRLTARLEPEVHRYLKFVSETEDISLNDALNLVISRYHHYPQDMAEIHRQITYCKGQLEIIRMQMELSEVHEGRLIELIESGQVEERLREMQNKEEAALEARHAVPPTSRPGD